PSATDISSLSGPPATDIHIKA
ncbi:hypothetical protein A2U01_0115871, partial [Trifolium medium]|nr:hypothetical protein [Trifolium medium]